MTTRSRVAIVLAGAFLVAIILAACGGPTQYEIVATFESDRLNDSATATAAVVIAAGGDPNNPQAAGGVAGAIGDEQARLDRQATAVAEATRFAGLDAESTVQAGQAGEEDVSALPLQDGEVTVEIGDQGIFTPDVIRITVGTTVIWQTSRRTASNTKSLPDQAESWNSGDLYKSPFDQEPATFSHTFTNVGCFKYDSVNQYDVGTGTVCVE